MIVAQHIDEFDYERGIAIWITEPEDDFDYYVGSPEDSDWPVDESGHSIFEWFVPFPNYVFPAHHPQQ